jgi:hypothetical protein
MVPLLGDPELDFDVPQLPRVLPELIWSSVDNARLLVMGTTNGLIVPKHIGDIELVDFANQVDGTRTVEELVCDAEGQIDGNRRLALSLLFVHGLLEDCSSDASDRGVPATTLAFLARIMDQTRVCRSRGALVERLRRPLGLVGAPEAVTTYLRASGVNASTTDLSRADDFDLCVIFVNAKTDFSLVEGLNKRLRPLLLISVQEHELRVGPMVLGPGTASMSVCREIHGGSACSSDAELWDIVAANAVLLIHSGTAAVNLLSQYVSYRLNGGSLGSKLITLPRTRPDNLEAAARERLVRQSAIAAPPARYAGYKAYEIHYTPSFLEASQQIPRAVDDSNVLTGIAANACLLKALDLAFGYRADRERLVRNCPTGGNLGSPEALVVDFDHAGREQVLYRFLSSPARLERIARSNWDPPPGSCTCRVVASIGNATKLRFKYRDFGDNLVHIDAGIASAFFSRGFSALTGGQPRFELARTSGDILGRYLADRNRVYALTWTATLPLVAVRAGESRAYRKLRKVIRARRAARKLEPAGLHRNEIIGLIERTAPREFEHIGWEIIPWVRLLVLIDEPNERSTILLSIKNGALSSQLLDLVVDRGETISQRLLAAAPIKIFFLLDLPEILRRFGAESHDNALALCGAWVGALWLEAEIHGLAGCPAGVVAESEILSQMKDESAQSWFCLVSFVLGARIQSSTDH